MDTLNAPLRHMLKPETPTQRTMSVPEAAAALGISRATAYRLAQRDAFPVRVLKIGARRLVSTSDLNRYLDGEAG